MNWIKCTDKLPDTSRRVEISDTEDLEHGTVIVGYYIEGKWHHVTGVPIDRIFGFDPKMWRDKDNVCDKG